MRGEMIFVGTELLLGQIINTNAAYLGENLATLGVDLFHSSVVGDNLDRIKGVIQTALERSDLILITGGLDLPLMILQGKVWQRPSDESLCMTPG